MTDAAAATLTTVKAMQSALTVLYTLQMTDFRYPPDCALTNASHYDYIILGGGTAGSVLASRLSERSSNKVLLVEAGSYPPWESEVVGLFPLLAGSKFDYNTRSVDDSRTAQNLQNCSPQLTAGRMLGGSSNIDHAIYVRGNPHDYNQWASMLGDDRWTHENLLPYFKLVENFNGSCLAATSYGMAGMMKLEQEISNVSKIYLDMFKELGYPTVEDTTAHTSSIGASNPFFTIGDNLRQSTAYCYLHPAKSRSNLCVALSTTATKILFKGSTAVGVQVTTSSGKTLALYAKKEVIVSAGAIHSPKLLMLSGIGPKSDLEELGIKVVADLPVGKNFMDHPSVVLVYTVGNSFLGGGGDPYIFPTKTTTLYAALNSTQTYPDYQAINLHFPRASAGLMQLCSNVFKYTNDICNKIIAANEDQSVLFVVHNLMMPKSRGYVKLASTDFTVEPRVYTGIYSDASDLKLMVNCLKDFNRVLKTSYFEANGAALVDTGLCTGKTGDEFWECYVLEMSAITWHYAGTCAMGSVVDSEMKVKNVSNLRVSDASIMPTEVSGNIRAAVTMIGERGAAFILSDLINH